MGPTPPNEATVNALHVQKYRGHGWYAPQATGATAKSTALAIGLAESQMTRVMANIPMPKYSGSPVCAMWFKSSRESPPFCTVLVTGLQI